MNFLRTDYTMLKDYKPVISDYWLLGFVEGEGSFSIVKSTNYRFKVFNRSVF
jgi:hypothetical protein